MKSHDSAPILVSGFEPFGWSKSNISSEVLPELSEVSERVETVTLPVVFEEASEQLIEKIKALEPAAVVMFGLAPGKKLLAEQEAHNRQFAFTIPDNAGNRRLGRIMPGEERTLYGTLPFADINEALADAGIPNKLSRSAGAFVCNDLYYRTLHHVNQAALDSGLEIPTGFYHIGSRMEHSLAVQAAQTVTQEVAGYLEAQMERPQIAGPALSRLITHQ